MRADPDEKDVEESTGKRPKHRRPHWDVELKKEVGITYERSDVICLNEKLQKILKSDDPLDSDVYNTLFQFNKILSSHKNDVILFSIIAEYRDIQLRIQELMIQLYVRKGMKELSRTLYYLSNYPSMFPILFEPSILEFLCEYITNPYRVDVDDLPTSIYSYGDLDIAMVSHIRRKCLGTIKNCLFYFDLDDDTYSNIMIYVNQWFDQYSGKVLAKVVEIPLSMYRSDTTQAFDIRQFYLAKLSCPENAVSNEAAICLGCIINKESEEKNFSKAMLDFTNIAIQDFYSKINVLLQIEITSEQLDQGFCLLSYSIITFSEQVADLFFEMISLEMIQNVLFGPTGEWSEEFYKLVNNVVSIYDSKYSDAQLGNGLINQYLRHIEEGSATMIEEALHSLSDASECLSDFNIAAIAGSNVLRAFERAAPDSLEMTLWYSRILSRVASYLMGAVPNLTAPLSRCVIELTETDDIISAAEEDGDDEYIKIAQSIAETIQQVVDYFKHA